MFSTQGTSEQELFAVLDKWKCAEDKHWKNGKVSGGIYHGGDKLKEVLNRAYGLFSTANPLHPELFPFVRKMEAEIVRMSCTLFNGGYGYRVLHCPRLKLTQRFSLVPAVPKRAAR